MGKVKVLTVQFDVTGLSDEVIDQLQYHAEVQCEDIEVDGDVKVYQAEHFRSNVTEVDTDDVLPGEGNAAPYNAVVRIGKVPREADR